jgi:hypothetical protein
MSNSTDSLVAVAGSRYHYENILTLQEDDLFRNGAALNINNIFERIIYFIVDLFTGGTKALDNREFDLVWQRSLNEKIGELEDLASHDNYNADFFAGLKKVLLVKAKLEVSGWARHLNGNANYQSLVERVGLLHTLGKEHVATWAEHERAGSGQHPAEVRRWIEASEFQRKFAAASPSGQLPYKMSEIPAGSVLLTDVDSSMAGLRAKGLKPTFCQYFQQFKAGLVKLMTGSSVIHAEIALGGGRFFHLDKVEGQVLSGSGVIEDRNLDSRGEPRICFQHQIWTPNRDRIVENYNRENPSHPVRDFDELFDQMRTRVDNEGRAVCGNILSIAKPGIPSRRPTNYDPHTAWDPRSGKNYACSGVVAALYGKFGTDIGRQFGKMAEDVSPADYQHSEYFRRCFAYSHA